jgi:hypothetical protein
MTRCVLGVKAVASCGNTISDNHEDYGEGRELFVQHHDSSHHFGSQPPGKLKLVLCGTFKRESGSRETSLIRMNA